MKQKLWKILCLCSILLLTGCDFELVSPDSLITAPELNQEKLQQKQLITSFLSKEESLIVPEGGEYAEAYTYADVDLDGEEEIIAFYADKVNNFMLGFILLDQKNENWYLSHKVIGYGTGIHYFSMQDLDQDGCMEFLLGVKTGYGSMKELSVYHLTEEELIDITKETRISYDQITLAKNRAGKNVLVTACMDTTVLAGSSDITVYSYTDQSISSEYNETFDGYCSEMYFGQVGKNQLGVYLAMRRNHFMNILLLKETEEGFHVLVEHPLLYEYDDMNRVHLFKDENNDGIAEIYSLWEPEENTTTKSYQDYIQVWLQWDGEEGVRAVDAILENSAEGYYFRIPLEWLDVLYYDFRSENAMSWIDFYYENEEMQYEKVFSFAAIDQYMWDEQLEKKQFFVLGNNPSKSKLYIAEIDNASFGSFSVNASKLNSCLYIEGGEQK